jgi:hypothetical protein
MNNQIQNAYINAVLADAAYIDVDSNFKSELDKRLIAAQANYLVTNFEVIASENKSDNPLFGSGFDAVFWKGKTGTDYANQVFVSMRGTEPGAGGADLTTDLSLASRGIPYEQVRDMANWWMRATAKPGDVVKQVKITATGNLAQVFTFTQDSTAVATGELYGQVAQISGVNGHSLGGYLATAFTRLFGANVGQVNTFNSAGFSDAAGTNIKAEFDKLESLLGTSAMGTGSFEAAGTKQTNYRAGNGVNLATNNWGEMPVLGTGHWASTSMVKRSRSTKRTPWVGTRLLITRCTSRRIIWLWVRCSQSSTASSALRYSTASSKLAATT